MVYIPSSTNIVLPARVPTPQLSIPALILINFNIHKYLRKLKITADERMNVPQKCTIGVRWLATAHTYPFLLIYLTVLSVPMFWISIPSLF